MLSPCFKIDNEVSIVIIFSSVLSLSYKNLYALVKTVYIDEKYFMTYATYVDNVSYAAKLGRSENYLNSPQQISIQLASTLLLDRNLPITDINTINCSSEHQQILVTLMNDILANQV